MKKIFLSLLFAGAGFCAFAQDYSKVQTMYAIKKYEDAKKEVDKLATDSKAKDKPETLVWKANVYAELAADSSLASKYPGAEDTAYSAYQAYLQKEPSLKTLKENGLRAVGVLYGNAFNEGKNYFGQSKWKESFDAFKKAEELSDFILKNGLGSNPNSTIDTFTVLYTGYAAQNSNLPDEAVKYYQKLADKKIGNEDMKNMYVFMLDHYIQKKDAENFNKYMAVAKELYPNDTSTWSQLEMSNMSANTSTTDMLSKYKQAEAAGNLTEDQYLSYAENFAGLTKGQEGIDSATQVQIKMAGADAYKKAFAIKNNGIYAYNAGVLYYSIFSDLDERFFNLRGQSADLKAKRDEVTKMQDPIADTAIQWLEKSYEVLKPKADRDKVESNSLNRAVDYLAILYGWKRDKAKGVDAKAVDKYDAKYQLYDSEHDKYRQ